MNLAVTFFLAFAFSFLGSIPPGTLNLTILRLGMERKMNVAFRFALAAALIEYPYAWIALLFEDWITSSPVIVNNFTLISALVMTTLGILTLRSATRATPDAQPVRESGFRKGLVLSILNPLALPFWIGITAYLKGQGWISLSNTAEVHSYLLGISVGAFVLLILVAYLAKQMSVTFSSKPQAKFIPGVILLVLGLYALVKYLLSFG
jgi:threonine/homoserine/homoserine lactone efflux protein